MVSGIKEDILSILINRFSIYVYLLRSTRVVGHEWRHDGEKLSDDDAKKLNDLLANNKGKSEKEIREAIKKELGEDVLKEFDEEVSASNFECKIWDSLKKKFGVDDLDADMKLAFSKNRDDFIEFLSENYMIGHDYDVQKPENEDYIENAETKLAYYEQYYNEHKDDGTLDQSVINTLEANISLLKGIVDWKKAKGDAYNQDAFDYNYFNYEQDYLYAYQNIMDSLVNGWEIAKDDKGNIVATDITISENDEEYDEENNKKCWVKIFDYFTYIQKIEGNVKSSKVVHTSISYTFDQISDYYPPYKREFFTKIGENVLQYMSNVYDTRNKEGYKIYDKVYQITENVLDEEEQEIYDKYSEKINSIDFHNTIIEFISTYKGGNEVIDKLFSLMNKSSAFASQIINKAKMLLFSMGVAKDGKITANELLSVICFSASIATGAAAGGMLSAAIWNGVYGGIVGAGTGAIGGPAGIAGGALVGFFSSAGLELIGGFALAIGSNYFAGVAKEILNGNIDYFGDTILLDFTTN